MNVALPHVHVGIQRNQGCITNFLPVFCLKLDKAVILFPDYHFTIISLIYSFSVSLCNEGITYVFSFCEN